MSDTQQGTPLEEKARNVNSLTPIGRWRLATSSKDIDVLTILSKDEDNEIAEAVALNSHTPAGVLDSLAKRVSVWCKIAVAKNPNTSLGTLAYLSEAVERDVRKEVAVNSSTSVEILDKLAGDKTYEVCASVVSNPNVSEQALLRLAKTEGHEMRSCVLLAGQKNLTIILTLINDEYQSVRENAKGLAARMDDNLLKAQADMLWGETVNGLPASYIRKLILVGQLKLGD